ncbi:MAG: hypothetical protein CFH30_00851 [Alphaproteobacteria bacterium MarineAlpha8_Bin1]|nr:MAG: hypothetical protein CFH30_00851 [Alphaproteobacteria bacterium MarineAlpha8_Bin1]
MLRIFPVLSFVLIFFLIFLGVENLTADFSHSNQSEPRVAKFDLDENSDGFSDKSPKIKEFKNIENETVKKNDKEIETQKLQGITETKDKLDKKEYAESEINTDTKSNLETTLLTKDKEIKNDKENILNGYRIQFGAFAKEKNAMEFKKKIENKLVKKFAFIELTVSYDNKKNFFRILSFVENEDIADQICQFSKNEKIGCLATKK